MPRLFRFLLLLSLWTAIGMNLIVWGLAKTKYLCASVAIPPGSCRLHGMVDGYCLQICPNSGVTGSPQWRLSASDRSRVALHELSVQYSLAKSVFGYRFWTSGSGRVYIAGVSYPATFVSLLLLLGAFVPWRQLLTISLAELPDVLFDDEGNVVQ